jgi:hypothetical protein
LRADLANYPRRTEANQPRSWGSVFSMSTGKMDNTWYERGRGPRWVRKDGTVRGKDTSEVLGRSWTTEVRGMFTEIRGIAGTRASYAPAVQDEDEQAAYHGARGWPTVQGVFRKRFTWLQQYFGRIVQRILQRIAQRG